MSFTCAKCGVALDLTQGPVILGEDEGVKRSRWIQQAGQHMAIMHPEVVQETILYTGLIGGAVLMRHINTDDPGMLRAAISTRTQLAEMLVETAAAAYHALDTSEVQ